MTSHEALEIVKQACAALNCDWNARVKIVEAVGRLESEHNEHLIKIAELEGRAPLPKRSHGLGAPAATAPKKD